MQFKALYDEYLRLGQPLHTKKLKQIVDEVDVELSKHQTFQLMEAEGAKGPNNEVQYLCNTTQKISWWVPTNRRFDSKIHKRTDGVPYLYETSAGSSVYCIDLQKSLLGAAEAAALANQPPLPGETRKDHTPLPGATTHGAVPLPGATLATTPGYLHEFSLRAVTV